MTEAIDLERRPPLDDGASAETVERLAAGLHAQVKDRGLDYVSARFCTREGGLYAWMFTAWPRHGAATASGFGSTPDEAAADLLAKLSGLPTEQQIAATLGLSEVPAND